VKSKLAVNVPLGLMQTVAWASSYYLLAILAEPMARYANAIGGGVRRIFPGAFNFGGNQPAGRQNHRRIIPAKDDDP
jgi:hypothetical protein